MFFFVIRDPEYNFLAPVFHGAKMKADEEKSLPGQAIFNRCLVFNASQPVNVKLNQEVENISVYYHFTTLTQPLPSCLLCSAYHDQ